MGADGAFKKAAKAHRRTHKERAQPEERAKRGAGLLEKHKDYVVRARNYNEKQRRLKALMEKARFRNPDEFYFKMVNSRTKDGVHQGRPSARSEAFDMDTMKLLKTQDANYVVSRAVMEAKKIEKLQSTLHLVDAPEAVAAGPAAPAAGAKKGVPPPKHIVFVDSDDEARRFDAAAHFDTVPELLDRPANRLRKQQLEQVQLAPSDADLEAIEHERERSYKELAARMDRAVKLKDAADELNLQRQLMGKGRRRKVGRDARGLPVYKWAKERKK